MFCKKLSHVSARGEAKAEQVLAEPIEQADGVLEQSDDMGGVDEGRRAGLAFWGHDAARDASLREIDCGLVGLRS